MCFIEDLQTFIERGLLSIWHWLWWVSMRIWIEIRRILRRIRLEQASRRQWAIVLGCIVVVILFIETVRTSVYLPLDRPMYPELLRWRMGR